MDGTEHCPHCDCGNPEGYERCMACAMSPSERADGKGAADACGDEKHGRAEEAGWYGVGTRGKSGPYKSLREAMVRSGV